MSNRFKIATLLLLISLCLPFAIHADKTKKERLSQLAVQNPELFDGVDTNDISIGFAWLFELCAKGIICSND